MTEQENRQYAVTLLNRADVVLSTERIAVVARVVQLVEADLMRMLRAQNTEAVQPISLVKLAAIAIAIEQGAHRPVMARPQL